MLAIDVGARASPQLAILGFVSFTATVILQFIPLPEDKKMLFE